MLAVVVGVDMHSISVGTVARSVWEKYIHCKYISKIFKVQDATSK